MISIRNNTFETNSSSTHCIAIGTESQFEDWRNGKLLFKSYVFSRDTLSKGFYTIDELKQNLIAKGEYTEAELSEMDEDDLLQVLRDDSCYDYDSWYEELEHDTTTYTTPNGENIIIECAYGYQ